MWLKSGNTLFNFDHAEKIYIAQGVDEVFEVRIVFPHREKAVEYNVFSGTFQECKKVVEDLKTELAKNNTTMRAIFYDLEGLYQEVELCLGTAKAKGYEELVVAFEEQKERIRREMIRTAKYLGLNLKEKICDL